MSTVFIRRRIRVNSNKNIQLQGLKFIFDTTSMFVADTSAAIGYNTGAMRIRFNKSVGSNATQQVDGPKDSCSNYIASTEVRAKYSPIQTQAW